MKGAASSIQQVCVCVCVCVCKGQLVQALSLAAEALQVRESMHHVYERTYKRANPRCLHTAIEQLGKS